MWEKCRFQPLRHSRCSSWCFTFFFLKCKVAPRSWHDESTRIIRCHSRHSLYTSCCHCSWVCDFACCAKLCWAFGLGDQNSCWFWCLSLKLWAILAWYPSWVPSISRIYLFSPFEAEIDRKHSLCGLLSLLFLCKQTRNVTDFYFFLSDKVFVETTPKKARRCQLTDRGSSIKCVTSKQNKEQSLIQTGWKRRCRWRFSVRFHLWCCWCPDERVWQSVRTSLLPLCVQQSPFCPLVDLWRSWHLQAFRNRGGIFFFWPVKYEWGSLSGDNSWPKDSAGNEHTAAWRRWTSPFLRATSVTVASGFTNLEKRYY